MPFTPAHAAIVLPLNYLPRKYVSISALVVGSMVPDFEYFIRMRPVSIYSHTLNGLFWFDVPLGFLLLILFDRFVRNILIDNLPIFLNSRLVRYKHIHTVKPSLLRLFIIASCLLIGAMSHLFWDAFTHVSGYFVTESLLSNITHIAGHTVPMFKILQHTSTLLGFVIIGYAIMQLPMEAVIVKKRIISFWITITGTAILTVIIRLITGLSFTDYGSVIVSFITGGLLDLLIVGIYLRGTLNYEGKSN
ncbi:DUF4184 family protein [Mucilaginibacter limnophilus]|uniref:DUF4184 family protein n=1 Tax=Mucilaginibacter limnophilus TaxID=1932778 RepID=A0A3S2WYY5_9SPHI|nr:DUF4184 family protein [Mucilaginibacter limnophilus]RVU01430.1 DUF4184 family protein [Mucilaginibacter limnophilus]